MWVDYGEIQCSHSDMHATLCTESRRQYETGESVLKYLGIKADERNTSITMLFVTFAVIRVLGLGALYRQLLR